jgi:Fe2+ transport system protein FeoA
MLLSDAIEGAKLVITGTDSEDVSIQALRFGISDGAVVTVSKNIKGGPVIIVRKQMELAIGRQLACAIEVAPHVQD